jgi:hypothetical protein
MHGMDRFKDKIEDERNQLIASWRWRLARQSDWIADPWSQVSLIFAASNGALVDDATLGGQFRQFHNKLGFRAWGSDPNRGGLCGGAIFRTPAFMAVSERRYKKKPVGTKTIHIEHTFPIAMLCSNARKARFANHVGMLRWMLQHSVATATSEPEQRLIHARYRKWSGALDPIYADEFRKPFMRYGHVWSEIGTIWNVFDREEVDPSSFTFDDHLRLICRVLSVAGADPSFIAALR